MNKIIMIGDENRCKDYRLMLRHYCGSLAIKIWIINLLILGGCITHASINQEVLEKGVFGTKLVLSLSILFNSRTTFV